MSQKLVTCTKVGVYGHAITKGKLYEVVAENNDKVRIIGNQKRRVWIAKYYFTDGIVEIPILQSWKFDDELDDFYLIEVTLTFDNGMKRWCLVTTPERLMKYFEQPNLDPPGCNIQHLIIVKTMNGEDIERTLKYLDEQGEIEKATILLD